MQLTILLSYYFLLKIKIFFRKPIINSIILLYLVINTAFLYFVINILTDQTGLNNVRYVLGLLIFPIILIKDFIPFKPYQNLFPTHYPLNNYKIVILEIISSLFSPIILTFLVLVIALQLKFPKAEYINLLFDIFSGILMGLNLRSLISSNTKRSKLFLSTIIFSILIYTYLLIRIHEPTLMLPISFGIMSVGVRLILLNLNSDIFNDKFGHTFYKQNKGLIEFLIIILLKSPKLRIPIFICFIFKSILLIGNLISLQSKGVYIFNSEILFYVSVSSLPLFTYVLNNYFGYIPSVFVLGFRTGLTKNIYFPLLTSFGLLVLVDFFLTFSLLYLFNMVNESILLYYILSVAGFILIGILGSFLFPIKVSIKYSLTGFKTSTSIVTSLLNLSVILSIVYNNFIVYILIILTISSILVIFFTNYEFRIKRFENIFKIIKE